MSTRRHFIKMVGLTGAALSVPGLSRARHVQAQVPGGAVDAARLEELARELEPLYAGHDLRAHLRNRR